MYADQPTGRFFSLRTVNLTRVSKLLAKLSSAVSFHCILASPAGFPPGGELFRQFGRWRGGSNAALGGIPI